METSIIIALIGCVVSFISWIAGRKKRYAELQAVELENAKKVWEIVNYQTKKIEELQREILSLKDEIKRMCTNCRYKKAYTNKSK